MRKATLSILVSLLCLVCANAQDIVFTVDSANFNIGSLLQNDTVITHTYEFCNEGTDTIYVKRIEPTCPLVIGEWTKEGIGPDMTWSLTVSMDTENLFGKFEKSLYIYGNMPTIRLSLSGNRLATPTYKEEDYSAIPQSKAQKKKKRLK